MARRKIFQSKPKMITTTLHPAMFSIIEDFRKEYMKLNGKYINNSQAGELIAKKIQKIRPTKIRRKRINVI